MMEDWILGVSGGAPRIERQQLMDEGRDTGELEPEFEALTRPGADGEPGYQARVVALLDRSATLPVRPGYPYDEPSDLEGIRRARPDGPRRLPLHLHPAEGGASSMEALFDRVHGAWLGRCSGCLLGKPVEGWRLAQIQGYLHDLGRYPLDDYFRSDVPDEIFERYGIPRERAYVDRVSYMVEDDDTNYTVLGLAVMKNRGPTFTPADVAAFWLEHLPIRRTYTAERVAYRNFCQLIAPPDSASYHNPFREWIGAQIRADFWGYAAPGNPELAAEYAWRDACISHVKNGIYGEMWVAAMLAAAPCMADPRQVIEVGLSEIPAHCRLAQDVRQVLGWWAEGMAYETAAARIHQRWDETNSHHWCHTDANAQIVAIGLLWGGGHFERSICRAVQIGFDTDCNGATVGSIIGMLYGARSLPARWVEPLHDTLESSVAGYARAKISDLAREGFALALAAGGIEPVQ